jgi:hypothetical protein
MLPKLRRCSQCHQEFPETLEYFKHTNYKQRKGWESWCRGCCNAKCRQYSVQHREELKAKRLARHAADPFRKRLTDLKYRAEKSGICVDLVQAQEVIRKFSGYCAICGAAVAGSMLCLDHCHTTGKVRGIICRSCNSGLGAAEESPTILLSLLTYLERNPP